MRNANGETLALVMVVAKYRVGEGCRVDGCCTTWGKGQGGQGYCPKHYQQLLRTGHAEPRSVWARRALREAVFAWAEDSTPETVGALFRAACDLIPTGAGPVFDGDIDPDLAALLLHAADAYAWHPSEPEYDASFVEASAALDEAAEAFARSIMRTTNLRGRVAAQVAARDARDAQRAVVAERPSRERIARERARAVKRLAARGYLQDGRRAA